jgi:hypothetical protein
MGNRTQLRKEFVLGIHLSQYNTLHSMFINHHLDIEAELEGLIRSQLRAPDSFDVEDPRFPFPKKVDLARALVGPQPDDDLWDILLKFNETRNAIAHRDKKDPQTKFNELSKLVTNAPPSLPVADDTQVMMSALKICTWFIRDIKQSLPPPGLPSLPPRDQ